MLQRIVTLEQSFQFFITFSLRLSSFHLALFFFFKFYSKVQFLQCWHTIYATAVSGFVPSLFLFLLPFSFFLSYSLFLSHLFGCFTLRIVALFTNRNVRPCFRFIFLPLLFEFYFYRYFFVRDKTLWILFCFSGFR